MDCLGVVATQIRVVQKPRHPLAFVSVRQDPCAMASITQAEYDSLISRLAAVEEENAATLLEVDT